MEMEIFLSVMFVGIGFFIFANGYNIYKIRKLGKLIRESGLVVSAHIPVVLVNNNHRNPVFSPDGNPSPPTYVEAQQHQQCPPPPYIPQENKTMV